MSRLLISKNCRLSWVPKACCKYVYIVCNSLLNDYTILRNIRKEGFNCIKKWRTMQWLLTILTPHTWKKDDNRGIKIHRVQSYSCTVQMYLNNASHLALIWWRVVYTFGVLNRLACICIVQLAQANYKQGRVLEMN